MTTISTPKFVHQPVMPLPMPNYSYRYYCFVCFYYFYVFFYTKTSFI